MKVQLFTTAALVLLNAVPGALSAKPQLRGVALLSTDIEDQLDSYDSKDEGISEDYETESYDEEFDSSEDFKMDFEEQLHHYPVYHYDRICDGHNKGFDYFGRENCNKDPYCKLSKSGNRCVSNGRKRPYFEDEDFEDSQDFDLDASPDYKDELDYDYDEEDEEDEE